MSPVLLVPGFELRAALGARPRLRAGALALRAEAGGEEPLPRGRILTTAAEADGVKTRDASRRGADHVPVARPRRPRPGDRGARSGRKLLPGGSRMPAPPSGRAGQIKAPVVSGARGVERVYGGVSRRSSARSPRSDRVGSARRRRRGALRRACGRERGSPGQILLVRRRRRTPSSSRCRSRCCHGAEPVREARGTRPALARRAAAAPGRRGRGAAGSGGKSRPGGSPRAAAGARSRAEARLGAGRGARLPGSDRERLTLRRALGSLLERLLARPERAGRPFRKLALVARLVDGGSWRRVATLRDATAETARLRAALGPSWQELPAPIVELGSRRSSSRSTRGSSSRSSSRRERRPSCACVKG